MTNFTLVHFPGTIALLEAIPQERQAMTQAIGMKIRERVERIETTPSIPAVFLPLLNLLTGPPEGVRLEEVVKLVSYDNTIVANVCARQVPRCSVLPRRPFPSRARSLF